MPNARVEGFGGHAPDVAIAGDDPPRLLDKGGGDRSWLIRWSREGEVRQSITFCASGRVAGDGRFCGNRAEAVFLAVEASSFRKDITFDPIGAAGVNAAGNQRVCFQHHYPEASEIRITGVACSVRPARFLNVR